MGCVIVVGREIEATDTLGRNRTESDDDARARKFTIIYADRILLRKVSGQR